MERNIQCFMVLNWRTEQMRVVQKYPSLQPYEVAIKVKFKLIKPDSDIPIIDFGTIEIPAVIIETDSAEVLAQASMG